MNEAVMFAAHCSSGASCRVSGPCFPSHTSWAKLHVNILTTMALVVHALYYSSSSMVLVLESPIHFLHCGQRIYIPNPPLVLLLVCSCDSQLFGMAFRYPCYLLSCSSTLVAFGPCGAPVLLVACFPPELLGEFLPVLCPYQE